jgi:hypothetical protein
VEERAFEGSIAELTGRTLLLAFACEKDEDSPQELVNILSATPSAAKACPSQYKDIYPTAIAGPVSSFHWKTEILLEYIQVFSQIVQLLAAGRICFPNLLKG